MTNLELIWSLLDITVDDGILVGDVGADWHILWMSSVELCETSWQKTQLAVAYNSRHSQWKKHPSVVIQVYISARWWSCGHEARAEYIVRWLSRKLMHSLCHDRQRPYTWWAVLAGERYQDDSSADDFKAEGWWLPAATTNYDNEARRARIG